MPRSRIGDPGGPIVAHDESLAGAPRGASMHTDTAAGRSKRRGSLVVACLSAGLTAVLTGCGTRAATVALPDKPSHVQVASAKAYRPSARDLVIAAYEGYWRATDDALASLDASKAKAIMVGHVPASSIPALVEGLQAIWRKDEIGYGSPVFHIMSV